MKIDAKRLRDELYNSCMTQRQLAKKIGVSAVSVCRYLNGERQPRGETLVKISKELGVAPEYFFGEYDKSANGFFGKTRAEIRTYADGWTTKEKAELIDLLIESILRNCE